MLDQVYYATGDPTGLAGHLPSSPLVDREKLLNILKPNSTANFEHLVHYGGSYYCYLLCRALAAHVWDGGFRGDPFNPEAGQRLKAFLEGGSVDQTVKNIYSILPELTRGSSRVCNRALIKDLSRCEKIHGSSSKL
jgi:Zn-dependent oligopeptidase